MVRFKSLAEKCLRIRGDRGSAGSDDFALPLNLEEDEPFHIDEIVIGPTSNRTASRAPLDVLLAKREIGVSRIKISQTPLRH